VTSPAVEVRSFAVTIPAGTAITAPYTQDIYTPARVLAALHWKVPPGPSGLMGWRLTMSGGNPVIPTGGGWIIADDEDATWNLTDQPDSGFWELTGYNTDIYPHTVYLDFLLDLVGETPTVISQIPSSALSSPAPVTTTVGGYTTPVSVAPISIPPISIPVISVPPPITAIQPVFGTTPVSVPPVSIPPVTVPAPNVVGFDVATAIQVIDASGWSFGYLTLYGIAGVRNETIVDPNNYVNSVVVAQTNHPTGMAGEYRAMTVDLFINN